jgi:hypothetical protein
VCDGGGDPSRARYSALLAISSNQLFLLDNKHKLSGSFVLRRARATTAPDRSRHKRSSGRGTQYGAKVRGKTSTRHWQSAMVRLHPPLAPNSLEPCISRCDYHPACLTDCVNDHDIHDINGQFHPSLINRLTSTSASSPSSGSAPGCFRRWRWVRGK